MAAHGKSGAVRRATKDWSINFIQKKGEGTHLSNPPGFDEHHTVRTGEGHDIQEDVESLIVKRSWDIALGPIKQLPMNMFIMWMAGNTISIFPIMMVGMSIFRSFQALFTVGQTFKMIEGGQAPLQKLVYLLGNVAGVALAVYKCQSMGLLPTHASDWLAFVQPQRRVEYAGGGMVL